MEYYGVKFYGTGDFANAEELKKCEKVFDDYENWNNYTDINKIIELYNVKKYIDTGIRLDDWTDDDASNYQEKAKKVVGVIGKFFSCARTEEFADLYNATDILYKEDFLTLFYDLKVYNRFDDNEFSSFLQKTNIALEHILTERNVVELFGKCIKEYILLDAENVQFFVSAFLERKTDNSVRYYMPKELTEKDKENLVKQYIDSEKPNMGCLDLISREDNPDKLKLSTMTKFKAYKKFEKLKNEFFETHGSVKIEMEVSFRPMGGMGEEKSQYKEPCNLVYEYDKEWIENNLDYSTILNNFYWFEYVDLKSRCLLVSKPSEFGLVDTLFGRHGRKEYPESTSFKTKDAVALAKMRGYYDILYENKIELENVYKWFFENYLKEEFGVNGFVYERISSNSTYGEKNKLIASKIDHVLKQFELYSQYRVIDREYLEFSSQHIRFENISSLISKKYAYCCSEDLRRECNCFFSTQSILKYVERIGKAYNTFFEMILKEKVYYSDFNKIQIQEIEFLKRREDIIIDEEGVIHLQADRLKILWQLYESEYLCLAYEKNKGSIDIIEKMVECHELEEENTLFSRPEQKYFNYLLNKSEFSNGLDLRNKYSHSTNTLNEYAQMMDYFRFLIVMGLIIIKINEEFCLKEKLSLK